MAGEKVPASMVEAKAAEKCPGKAQVKVKEDTEWAAKEAHSAWASSWGGDRQYLRSLNTLAAKAPTKVSDCFAPLARPDESEEAAAGPGSQDIPIELLVKTSKRQKKSTKTSAHKSSKMRRSRVGEQPCSPASSIGMPEEKNRVVFVLPKAREREDWHAAYFPSPSEVAKATSNH